MAMTSASGPRGDPAPLFDLVTGFPPDDAVDVTIPMPLSLAVYMTVLESTGHAAELAVLKKIQVEQARGVVRSMQARMVDVTGAADPSTRLRITHIVEQRVPRVNGLRPHIHAYVGTTARLADGGGTIPVDVERLVAFGDAEVFPSYRERLAAVTADQVGLRWEPTAWSEREVVGPGWLAERCEQARYDDLSCPGPWPRRQVVVGREQSDLT